MTFHVSSIAEMNRELQTRCAAAGMQFDCGAGGLFTSKIAVVAEAPGEREVMQHTPLIGGSGKLLWDVLRRDGITRNHAYITNVVKRKLVNQSDHYGDTKDTVGKLEFEHWKFLLLDELSILPNVEFVMALGNYALQALTGEKGITAFRGSVLPVTLHGRAVKVICAVNPAAVLREPRQEIVFRMDCNKLVRVIEGRFKAPEITCHINPTYAEAIEFIEELEHSEEAIAHDIETMANETACVGLANSDTEGMCINWRSQGRNYYSLTEEREIRLALQRLLGDPRHKFIAQNGNFDAAWMWYKDRIRVHGYWIDTMLGHHLLYPALPHNLGFLTAQYTDYPYYKDEGKEWREEGDIDGFWKYNVKDCCITRIAAQRILSELEGQRLDDFFFNHVMKLQPHLVKMTVGGVLCDGELKQRITDDLTADVARARDVCQVKAQEATGIGDYAFNPRSWPDLGKLFFTDLKLVGRGTSTDRENRDRMRKHPRTSPAARECLVAVDEYLGEAKFLGTYAEAGIDDDGRFRCEYKQTGVQSAPGRLSSSGTMWGSGLNMQNIPERAKEMFVADPGYEFTYFDKAQIEARLVAWFANIPKWKAQFERARLQPGSYDAHCALASEMYHVPYDEVPKSDYLADGSHSMRFVAKRCRHGLNYRMGPDRLATTAGLSIADAETAWRLYHRATPEIQRWWDDVIGAVRRDRQLVTPFGRRWLLLERFDDAALDSVIAFLPQSTAGDLVASYIFEAEEHPHWPGDQARVVLNIHDALIVMHTHAVGGVVRSILQEINVRPITINGEELIIPADFGVSQAGADGVHRWSTIKKI